MFRYFLVAALAVAAALSTAGPTEARPPTKEDPFAKALAAAQAQVPGSILIKGRSETSKAGTPVFGFYFWGNGKVREIEISGVSGLVVKDTEKTSDPVSDDMANLIAAKGRGRVKLPDGRLAEIAADALRGTPLASVNYIRQGDRLLVQFGTVTLDTETGQVVPPAK